MTLDEVKASLGRAVKRAWPNAAKASDLPFPDFWKGAAEWLAFHAPHVGDGLMRRLIDDVVREAVLAEAAGAAPKPYRVSERVRAIWAMAERSLAIKSAIPGPAQPASLTDSSKTTNRGDGGRDRNSIYPRGGLGTAAPDRQGETGNSGGRPERRLIQGRLL